MLNTTHHYYKNLSSAMLLSLEQQLQQVDLSEAPAILQSSLNDETLDYHRLARLIKRDLREMNLAGERFEGMDLHAFCFRASTLNGANFQKANLTGAQFQHANLCGADLSWSNCSNSSWEQSLCQGCHAEGINLNEASMERGDWRRAVLTKANLGWVTASNSHFGEAVLDESTFSYGTFSRCVFAEASCRVTSWTCANLQDTIFQSARLEGSDLSQASLKGADLRGCVCAGVNFHEVALDAATQIDRDNHLLIGTVLLLSAATIRQERFALYIQYQHGLCWAGFLQLLEMEPPAMVSWVEQTLGTLTCLKSFVLKFRQRYDERLQTRRAALTLPLTLPEDFRTLVIDVWKQRQDALSPEQLYSYLQGFVAATIKQPAFQLSSEQQFLLEAALAEQLIARQSWQDFTGVL